MISSAWKSLLLWQISMLGGAFEQKGSDKKRGEGRRAVCGVFKRFRSRIT